MIETMYAAPGRRPGGAAGRRAAAHLRRRLSASAATATTLIVMVNPEFVERDGMQLEEEGCLSVPGFNATVARPSRAVVKGLDRHGSRADDRRHRPAGARLPARDGSPRRHAVRRSPARHQARSDRPEDPEAEARRQMVTHAARCASCSSARRSSRCRRSTRCSSSRQHRSSARRRRSPIGRGAAASSVAPTPIRQLRARARHPGAAAGTAERRGVPASRLRALAPDLGVVAAYGRILPDALLAIPRLGMINVHASLLPR